MSSTITFLLILLHMTEFRVLRVALEFDRNNVSDDTCNYPMEIDSRAELKALLPSYLRENFVIAEVRELDNIHVHTNDVPVTIPMDAVSPLLGVLQDYLHSHPETPSNHITREPLRLLFHHIDVQKNRKEQGHA